jgi:hypothetical protein
MVVKVSILLLSVILFFSCNPEEGYINHNKWIIPNTHEMQLLNGHPKEIREVLYRLNDSILSNNDSKKNEELYRFDDDGNLVYSLYLIDSFAKLESIYEYSDEGLQYRMCSYSLIKKDSCENITSYSSKKVGIHSFLVTKTRNGKKEGETLYTFENDKETRESSNMNGSKSYATLWYRDKKIIKTELKKEGSTVSTIYYRNGKGFLDSIIGKVQPKNLFINAEKKVFINNEYGDPLIYYSLQGKDTVEYETNKYKYDKNHNWTKRLTYIKPISEFSKSFPSYTLSVREIKY